MASWPDVRQSSTIAGAARDGQNFGMSEPSTAPGTLQDEELQNLATEWRMRVAPRERPARAFVPRHWPGL